MEGSNVSYGEFKENVSMLNLVLHPRSRLQVCEDLKPATQIEAL